MDSRLSLPALSDHRRKAGTTRRTPLRQTFVRWCPRPLTPFGAAADPREGPTCGTTHRCLWWSDGFAIHLGGVERRWLRWGFAAEDVSPFPADGEEWVVTPDDSLNIVTRWYQEEIRAVDAVVEGVPLDRRSRVGGRFHTSAEAPTLQRILFHLVQEYARHVGQLDVARQLIDGTTGE
ncbi:mycothiol transferase [Micromonospora sp. NBC_00421]|uniref:mycothiol transferase n=1 Tax=Micromonospora sp. NBC_00421 TaxID=2975976 RepID=UPI002E1D9A6C